MKAFFRLILGLLLTVNLNVHSQAQLMEKKLNGQTYIFNGALVSNKNRTDMSTSSVLGTDYTIPSNSVVRNTVKSVLGEKRVKELSKNRLIFRFGCKPNGEIEKVFFIFPDNNCFLTLEEIAELEKVFLTQRFPILLQNKNVKEVQFNQGCFFWRL